MVTIRVKIIVLTLIVICALSIGLFLNSKNTPYIDDYHQIIGVEKNYRYEDIKLEYESEFFKEVKLESGWNVIEFEDYTVICDEKGVLRKFVIDTPTIKLGNSEIGVGSSEDQVRYAYRNQLESEEEVDNQVIFIDDYSQNSGMTTWDYPWIFFKLDNQGIVIQIEVCPKGL